MTTHPEKLDSQSVETALLQLKERFAEQKPADLSGMEAWDRQFAPLRIHYNDGRLEFERKLYQTATRIADGVEKKYVKDWPDEAGKLVNIPSFSEDAADLILGRANLIHGMTSICTGAAKIDNYAKFPDFKAWDAILKGTIIELTIMVRELAQQHQQN